MALEKRTTTAVVLTAKDFSFLTRREIMTVTNERLLFPQQRPNAPILQKKPFFPQNVIPPLVLDLKDSSYEQLCLLCLWMQPETTGGKGPFSGKGSRMRRRLFSRRRRRGRRVKPPQPLRSLFFPPFPPTPREFHVSVRTAEVGGCSNNYRRGREGAKANIGVAAVVVAFGGHIKAILS